MNKNLQPRIFPLKITLIGTCTRSSLYVAAALRTLSQDGYFLLGRKLLECADGFKKLTSLKDKN
jgi:hypothetical protein